MDESPVSTLEQRKDRRGLLALIGAGGAAAVAALLGRSNGAEGHGTLHRDSSSSVPAIHGNHTYLGFGVLGTSGSGFAGVRGTGNATGVWGTTSSATGAGIFGDSTVAGATGVRGESQSGNGIYGEASTGTGVRGEGKFGVTGKATSAGGVGLYGNAGSGAVGVLADASSTKAALKVRGRASFKQSGKATVSAGATSKVVPLGFTLASGSLVVATLQGNAGSGVAVRTASKYGTAKIRITLTKAATRSATIAYFIFTP